MTFPAERREARSPRSADARLPVPPALGAPAWSQLCATWGCAVRLSGCRKQRGPLIRGEGAAGEPRTTGESEGAARGGVLARRRIAGGWDPPGDGRAAHAARPFSAGQRIHAAKLSVPSGYMASTRTRAARPGSGGARCGRRPGSAAARPRGRLSRRGRPPGGAGGAAADRPRGASGGRRLASAAPHPRPLRPRRLQSLFAQGQAPNVPGLASRLRLLRAPVPVGAPVQGLTPPQRCVRGLLSSGAASLAPRVALNDAKPCRAS